MSLANKHIILCNDAKLPTGLGRRKSNKIIELNHTSKNKNVEIKLLDFITRLNYLPNSIKDLLEIATYVYAADRSVLRGTIKDVEFQSWSRNFHFVFKVRDIEFWNKDEVRDSLSETLLFMSGDEKYEFSFQPTPPESPCNLFDQEKFKLYDDSKVNIILFSGGLDSLAGTIKNLNNNKNDKVCLVSHLSGNPSTKKTITTLINRLKQEYPGRILYFPFQCNFKSVRGKEETQRTRSFLYSTIAFSLADAWGQNSFYYYENGITSINYLKREDQINSRASRTTHPKTISTLQSFFKLVYEKDITIQHPFLFKTKTDIFNIFKEHHKENYINNSVSCSKTFRNKTQATHCGVCSQCIDRRFAAFASGLNDFDDLGIYNFDFISDSIDDNTAKTTVIDYVRLAKQFSEMGSDMFCYEKMNELVYIIDYVEGEDDIEKTEKIYQLSLKHGQQIELGIKKMFEKYYSPYKKFVPNSFLSLISSETHFKLPVSELIDSIRDCLKFKI